MESSHFDEKIFIPNPKYIYKFLPVYAQDMAIEVKDGKINDGANIQLGESKNVPHQFFKIIHVEESKYYLEPQHCNNKVVEIEKGKMKSKTNIRLNEKKNKNEQFFKIVKVGNENTYSILSCIDENFCLDVQGKGKKKGSNIQLYNRNHTIAQLFNLVEKRNIYCSFEYALKYSTERNNEFKKFEPNCANFCSQCLFAGGVETDQIWNKDTEAFSDPTKLRQYFFDKGIEWTEYPNYNDINPGDIGYMLNNDNKFDHPIFVLRKNNSQIIFCGNSIDIKEGSLNYSLIAAVLKTSTLFN